METYNLLKIIVTFQMEIYNLLKIIITFQMETYDWFKSIITCKTESSLPPWEKTAFQNFRSNLRSMHKADLSDHFMHFYRFVPTGIRIAFRTSFCRLTWENFFPHLRKSFSTSGGKKHSVKRFLPSFF